MSFSENIFRTNHPTDSSQYYSYIETLVQDLKQVTPDFKAYVFGSVAEGTSKQDSDLDILFLFPNSADLRTIRKKFFATKTRLNIETDLLFQTEDQFNQPDSLLQQSISTIMIEVYPKWTFHVNRLKYQKFKKESCHKLLRIAENDLYAAEFLLNAPKCRPELIIYQVQQSVEKSLKAVLISEEKSIPLTHDIDILISHLHENDQKQFPDGIGELTLFATIKRYTEGDELIEIKDAEASVQLGQFVISWAKNKIGTTDSRF